MFINNKNSDGKIFLKIVLCKNRMSNTTDIYQFNALKILKRQQLLLHTIQDINEIHNIQHTKQTKNNTAFYLFYGSMIIFKYS